VYNEGKRNTKAMTSESKAKPNTTAQKGIVVDSKTVKKPEKDKGGRPKGALGKKTKEEKVALELMKDKIRRSTDPLVTAMLDKAMGEKFLIVIETKRYKDDNGKWQKKQLAPKVVDDVEVIMEFLGNGQQQFDTDKEYHYMTTKPADVHAMKLAFAYGYGNPKNTTDVNVNTFSLSEVIHRTVLEIDDDDYGALEQFVNDEQKKKINFYKRTRQNKTRAEIEAEAREADVSESGGSAEEGKTDEPTEDRDGGVASGSTDPRLQVQEERVHLQEGETPGGSDNQGVHTGDSVPREEGDEVQPQRPTQEEAKEG